MSKLKGENGHITLKVVVGYLLLIAIAVACVTYVYRMVEKAVQSEDQDAIPRKKVYLITNSLSLLYESETVGQLGETSDDELARFNSNLNKVQGNLKQLRQLITVRKQRQDIDVVRRLIEQKRKNTMDLVDTWHETNAEKQYIENIERAISGQGSIVKPVVKSNARQVRKRSSSRRDIEATQRKKKEFLQSIANAFPDNEYDTGMIAVNRIRQIIIDSLSNSDIPDFNQSDTIVSVLKSIRDSVSGRRQRLTDILLDRASKLRYSNSVITGEINRMLRTIEEEEMEESLSQMQNKQSLMKQTSQSVAEIAAVAMVILIFFLIIILRALRQNNYYRQQLERSKIYAENLLHMRERLMLTISHDIRAPLSSIIGYIDLLLHRHPDDRQKYYLENMKGSSNHILSLVNDLLDFQRLESGKMEIHPLPFRIPVLFDEIYTSFKPLSDAKGLEFIRQIDKEGMNLVYMGDSIRIRQVVSNLLSNAIKFTEKGRIAMIVSVTNNVMTVKVCDSGPGIPESERERIFSEFIRLADTDKVEGFGLGLSITRKLISLMKGELSLESIPGKGSDFIFSIPLTLSENQALESQNNEEEAPVFIEQKVYCLLVDDDPLQLALTEELLKQSHVEVTSCTNPHQVTELMSHMKFDAIITDIQMPGMDGYHLLKEIRDCGLPNADKIPVIALSASIANEKDHYIEAGFTGFLNKPFTAAQLVKLLNEMLTVHLEVKDGLKLDSLTAFAGEDREASKNIIKSFTVETNKSIDLLKKALTDGNRMESARLSHKLIPTFAMLGANSLVQRLRILEKNDSELNDSGWKNLLNEVIEQSITLVKQVNQANENPDGK